MKENEILIGFTFLIAVYFLFFSKPERYGEIEDEGLRNAVRAREEADKVYEEAFRNKVRADYQAEMEKSKIDAALAEKKMIEDSKVLEAEVKAKEAEMKANMMGMKDTNQLFGSIGNTSLVPQRPFINAPIVNLENPFAKEVVFTNEELYILQDIGIPIEKALELKKQGLKIEDIIYKRKMGEI